MDALEIFEAAGAVIRDTHVVYTSGLHGNTYINKDAVYVDTTSISLLCSMMAEKYVDADVDTVLGPAIGAVILSQWTAHHLGILLNRKIASVYAEKSDRGFVIRRGYDSFVMQKKILIVEDVVTTGGSIKSVIDEVKRVNGTIVGVSALCNRGGILSKDLKVPRFEALLNIKLGTWTSDKCPLCQSGIPINTRMGKGKGL